MSRARTASPWSGCARSANRRRPAVRRTTSSARSSSATSPEQIQLERRGHGEPLQLLARGGPDVPGPQVDELGEPRPGLERAAPAPDAAVLGEQPAVDPVARQLADEQGVAARQVPDRAGGRAGDRAAEAGGEQRLDVVARQRAQLEHRAQLVLPQRAHGVRHRLTLPHGDERERLARGHELVDERGGSAVEQLSVVDAQDQPAPGRALGQRVAGLREPLGASGQRRRRQQRGERAERERGRGTRRAHPRHLGVRALRGRGDEPGLADPGRAGHHDAAGRAARQRLGDERELGSAPCERPPHARSLIDRAPVE